MKCDVCNRESDKLYSTELGSLCIDCYSLRGSPGEEYLTRGDVAKRLAVTEPTVSRWLRAGKLRGMKAGKEWRITLADYERFLLTLRGEQ